MSGVERVQYHAAAGRVVASVTWVDLSTPS
jgi:hypothetical protein